MGHIFYGCTLLAWPEHSLKQHLREGCSAVGAMVQLLHEVPVISVTFIELYMNTTVHPITKHPIPTQGLKRSPMRAPFQNKPLNPVLSANTLGAFNLT